LPKTSFRGASLAILIAVFAATPVSVLAQSADAETVATPVAAAPATTTPELSAPAAAPAAASNTSDRTRLNLLGEVDSQSGESRRNENVRLTLIDNNVLKELNERIGTTATIVKEFKVEQAYFGKEYGGNPSRQIHLPSLRASGTHGELFWGHQNSTFAARSFFQVGGVEPARTNDYGVTVTTKLSSKTALTVDVSERKLRGQVNGNILVPAADERVPTTTDPARLAIVQSILGAYPDLLPNRTDINDRALNTNAAQNINNDRLSATIDNNIGNNRLSLKYNITLQDVEAFQLHGGQNPDTTTKNHNARITWSRTWSPDTTSDFSVGYERIGSVLVPEETSIGGFFLFSRTLASIGPGGQIPIDRVQNMFRYAGRVSSTKGKHHLVAGFELLRKQINGFESYNHRGTFSFRRDFGRGTVENLLAGTASSYNFAVGDTHRGFRNWNSQFFIGDDWKANSKLTLNLGLRYEPVGTPTEVDGLSQTPFDGDWNNFAPSIGFAYRANDRWGVLRGAYSIQYGQIFNTTFMQTRFNQPGVLSLNVAQPDLVNPLKDFSAAQLDSTGRSTSFQLDPELSTPYSHQYNFSWELRPIRDWVVELGYVGSRSHKLLNLRYNNRAQPVEGIERTTSTVNERRPDQRFFDVYGILNGSIGYYDAAKVTLRVPRWAGLTVDASYWLSKSIDLASSYTNTASGRDGRNARSPTEFDVWNYMKALSDFDQPHAMLWRLSYSPPALGQANRIVRSIFGNWQMSSVVLLKSGTPFSIRAGSDGPGIGNVDGAGSDRPNVVDPTILGTVVDHPDTSVQKLNPAAFSLIGPTQLGGNLGRNTFRKDQVWNVNLGVSRRFHIAGDNSVLFQVESVNFLNHAQFAEPDLNLTSRTFAAITNTLNDGRSFKFTLKFAF
jgi:hypothetical protein